MSALSAYRESAAMPDTAIRAEIHEALDVLLNLTPQVAFNLEVSIDYLTDPHLFLGTEVVGVAPGVNVRFGQDFTRGGATYPIDISQRDLHPLVPGQLYSGYTGHS